MQVDNVALLLGPVQLGVLRQSSHRVDLVFTAGPRLNVKIVKPMDLADSTFLNPFTKRAPSSKPIFFILSGIAILDLNEVWIVVPRRKIAIVDAVVECGIDSLITDPVMDSSGRIGRAAVRIRVVVVDFHELFKPLFLTISDRVGPIACFPASPGGLGEQSEL